MEITITVNGKPVKATVDEQEMKEAMGEKKVKRTGYEADSLGYGATEDGDVSDLQYPSKEFCEGYGEYLAANFYTDKRVAENNVRADNLMRKLRRFAAEHGGCVSGKRSKEVSASFIDFKPDGLLTANSRIRHQCGAVGFCSEEAAKAAIEEFKDELIWYFTEYDPMPEGWWENP